MSTGAGVQHGTAEADARLAEEVAVALLWDLWVPDARVQARVAEGWVTLEGEVDSRCQREAAQRDVARIPGVAGVTNALTIRPVPPAEEVEARIACALGGCAVPGAIRIETFPGAVRLHGTVSSRAEREAAGRAAGSVPGVRELLNHLQVLG
jgi:osmotically-inducible protein OsmY